MDIDKRINSLAKLGEVLMNITAADEDSLTEREKEYSEKLKHIIQVSYVNNNWFIRQNIIDALYNNAVNLSEENLNTWLKDYDIDVNKPSKRIGLVLAGNIPMVGFHDLLCVLITGNSFIAKLSSKDKFLLPFIFDILCDINPGFENNIEFTEAQISHFDAIIATGSDNTSKIFEEYYSKYPNIIRKNRNSVAVIKGDESEDDLLALSTDIFNYFGLGCRNVSKIYIPENYDFEPLIKTFDNYTHVVQHKKYMNNYEYYRSILLMNLIPFLDGGITIFRNTPEFNSNISVINYEYYSDICMVNQDLKDNKEKIQCITSLSDEIDNAVPFGKTQNPELWDYADGIDTIDFLIKL